MRVAGENLLDESRSCTRQADDENRIGGRRAKILSGRKKFLPEQSFSTLHEVRRGGRIVSDPGVTQRVAGRVVFERLDIASRILQGLAESKVKMRAIPAAHVRDLEVGAHNLHFGPLEPKG